MHVAALYRYSTRRDTQVRGDRARGHDRLSRGTYSVSSLPEALPCHKYDDFYTHQADVWGNVIVRDEAEFQRWAAYCRPSSREEALENGGCVIFRPAPSKEKLAVPEETQYFYITAVDDVVYGRAAYVSADTVYLRGTRRSCRVTHLNAQTASRRNEPSSAADACKCNCLEQHVVDHCAQHFLF